MLAVYNILLRGQRVTAREIQQELDLRFDIQANRKTIYSDIYAIDRFIPIDIAYGKGGGYMKIDVLRACEDGK